jgi:hypothetical protein
MRSLLLSLAPVFGGGCRSIGRLLFGVAPRGFGTKEERTEVYPNHIADCGANFEPGSPVIDLMRTMPHRSTAFMQHAGSTIDHV